MAVINFRHPNQPSMIKKSVEVVKSNKIYKKLLIASCILNLILTLVLIYNIKG